MLVCCWHSAVYTTATDGAHHLQLWVVAHRLLVVTHTLTCWEQQRGRAVCVQNHASQRRQQARLSRGCCIVLLLPHHQPSQTPYCCCRPAAAWDRPTSAQAAAAAARGYCCWWDVLSRAWQFQHLCACCWQQGGSWCRACMTAGCRHRQSNQESMSGGCRTIKC